jgi:hypothetical protein
METRRRDAARITGSFSSLASGARQALTGIRRVLGAGGGYAPQPAEAEDLLEECVTMLVAGDTRGARARVLALRAYADGEISAEERRHYRVIISEDRILRPDLPLGSLDVPFCDMVLRLAFGQPFNYQMFCDLEDRMAVLGEDGQLRRRDAVLAAIDNGGTRDTRVLALTRFYLGRERLERWFRSGELDLSQLVTALAAGEWHARQHANIAFAVTHLYLDSLPARDSRQGVIDVLRPVGYLADTLRERYPGKVASQVTELTSLLSAAYPRGLTPADIPGVFDVSATAALARAALRTLADKSDARLVLRAFARKHGQELGAEEEEALLARLTVDR